MVNNRIWFPLLNGAFLILLSLIMLAPFIHILAISFSSAVYAQAKIVYFLPKGFQLDTYADLLSNASVWNSLGVSAYITVFGTLLTLALTSTMAFALSRPGMPLKKWVMRMLVISFIFPAPLIPSFLLVRTLGMVNTLWSLMIPAATSAFYVIIMKTFFQNIPKELMEAAKIDGCGEASIYWRMVLPLSGAVLATIGLFQAVAQWNSYYNALIFIRDKELYPIQLLLKQLVSQGSSASMTGGGVYTLNLAQTPEIIQACMVIIATLPMVSVYPFLQKFFVKGALLGSIKE